MFKLDFDLLKRLCDMPGPSGYEEDVRDLIRREITPYVKELYCDPMGNLIAVKGKNAGILYDAHMDEVGFMVTGILEDGTIRFYQIGSVTPDMLPGKRVLIGKDRIPGVISASPVHLSKESGDKIPYEALRITIGTDSKEKTEKVVSIGDGIVFDTHFSTIGIDHNTIAARNLDDRLGCYLLIQMIKNDKIQNAVFSFSVQEETGDRGASAIAEEIDYRYGIAVDTTSASNLPGVERINQVCAMGSGGVLSFIDKMTVYNNEWIRSVFDRLEDKGILIQTKGRNCGGTNASALQKTGVGRKSLSLSTPAYYIHGPISVVAIKDVEYMSRALEEIHAFLTELILSEGGQS